jgi:putative methionine-R-sulfoxide reductase with GAF domain
VTEKLDLDVFAVLDAEHQTTSKTDRQLLTTLFALGREVASVLDLDELLAKLPDLIARITDFHAFAIYLLDETRGDLHIACAKGYPDDGKNLRLALGQGLVGAAVDAGRPLMANDVSQDPRYIEAVPGTRSELVVPIRRKGRVIGALNLLSRNPGEFTPAEVETLRNFASTVAVAIENARLFVSERKYTDTLETLAEIGRDMSSILDLGELLKHVARSVKRVIDYRTFGILLLDENGTTLEMKHAVRYDEQILQKRVEIGQGLVGYAALNKVPVLVPDVTADPRYIKVVEDVRCELVIPLLLKDRCIGVFDLESPELGAFTRPAPPSPSRTPGCTTRSGAARSASRRKSGSPSACSRRSSRRRCRSASNTSRSRGCSSRRGSWAATCTIFCRPTPTRWLSPWAMSRARAFRQRSTAHLPAS